MKRIYKLMFFGILTVGLLVAAGCGGAKAPEGDKTGSANNEGAPEQAQSVAGLTKENPIKVNKDDGSMTFLAQVNGKYFYEPTRHAAVFEGGSNGEKAVFKGLVDVEPFHNALTEIGAKAGENMTLENKEKTAVEGDILDVTVTWEGANKDYTLDEAIKSNNNKPIVIHYGGNLKNALAKKTGCLICLDSCPVGITSNSAYTYGAVEKRNEVEFKGNKDVLPADGTLVAITMKVKK